jgi:DNA-binding response OmpR family regulator
VCDLLSQFVRFCGHEVVATVSGGGLAVIQSFARLKPEVVLLDVLMPRFNGLTVCHALKSRQPDTKIILISGMVEEHHPFVSGCGAHGFLHKPMHIDELRDALDALERLDEETEEELAQELEADVIPFPETMQAMEAAEPEQAMATS